MNWPVTVDDHDYEPVPESWIEHGTDHDHGSPRLYAVSVAHAVRDMICVRYAARDGAVYRVTMQADENPTADGTVPASLANYGTWPRSIVPASNVEPVGALRGPERAHFRELWADRAQGESGISSAPEVRRDLITAVSGGRSA